IAEAMHADVLECLIAHRDPAERLLVVEVRVGEQLVERCEERPIVQRTGIEGGAPLSGDEVHDVTREGRGAVTSCGRVERSLPSRPNHGQIHLIRLKIPAERVRRHSLRGDVLLLEDLTEMQGQDRLTIALASHDSSLAYLMVSRTDTMMRHSTRP